MPEDALLDETRRIVSLQWDNGQGYCTVNSRDVADIRAVRVAGQGSYVAWLRVSHTDGRVVLYNAAALLCVEYAPEEKPDA